MKTRCHVLVFGKVHGVFFRSTTHHLAVSLGVTGWVRNLPDDSLEAVLEGDKEAVYQLLDFIREGPPGAQIKDVKIQWDEYKGEFQGFQIRS